MKLHLTVIFIILLSGCAVAELKDKSAIRPESELPIKISDERPKSQKSTEIGSLLITSCTYGLTRFGDSRYSPSPVLYLANYINNLFQPKEANETVQLHRLEIYANSQASLRKDTFLTGAAPLGPGLIPSLMWNGSCYSTSKAAGGVDFSTEDPEGRDAIVVYLEATFRGQNYSSRHVQIVTTRGQGLPIFTALDATFDAAFKGGSDAQPMVQADVHEKP